jgi:hypothetical protein
MFTLEESDLLARMLRVLGWTLLCLCVVLAALLAHRWHLLDRLTMLLSAVNVARSRCLSNCGELKRG